MTYPVRSALVVVALVAAAAACTGDDAQPAADRDAIQLAVVSSPAEYVSGGEALVAVTVADDIDPSDVAINAGGADVTDAFEADPDDEQRLVGLIDGLEDGENTLTAEAGEESGDLTVTNYPTQGPMFSGDQFELAVCTTSAYGLGESTLDDGCMADTMVTWQYVNSGGEVKDLADPTQVPDDAQIIEADGDTVPFIIRNERGVLNRSIYQISLLDPTPDIAGRNLSAWNGRLLYRFGGGCGSIPTQGYLGVGELPLEELRSGFAAATATFNTFQVVCNDVISAETASMVKEHFIETYGEPVHTIGEGGSGGAIQQLLLAQNFPGLLDGIAPSVPFPDAISISGGVYDCALLTDYYATPDGSQLGPDQRAAINGHGSADTCGMWDATFANTINPNAGCKWDVASALGGAQDLPLMSDEAAYDPATNPDGVRCTVWEMNTAFTGVDPETGFARPGYDNVGVQYGLDALNAGGISVAEFLDLNETIGGFDDDGQPVPERSEVDDSIVERAYETGRVTGPWGGLTETPVILTNLYRDSEGDIHDRVRSFSLLDRLAGEEDEVPDTVSLWTTADDVEDLTLPEATFVLDEWLTAAEERHADKGGSWADALARTKPDDAESRCLVKDEEPIVGPDANEDEVCTEAYPINEEPRMAAGAERAGNVLKCQLIPVDEAVEAEIYEVELRDAELDRLADIFPDGVCDYSKESVGFAEPASTWQQLG